jgi:hypothetical protein
MPAAGGAPQRRENKMKRKSLKQTVMTGHDRAVSSAQLAATLAAEAAYAETFAQTFRDTYVREMADEMKVADLTT